MSIGSERVDSATVALGRLALVTLDCPDPVALAAFYQNLIGGEINDAGAVEHGWVQLNTDVGINVGFQRNEMYRTPEWPDGDQQAQAHLDIAPDDWDAAISQAEALGARRVGAQPSPDHWIVFLDPVGHPFCLVKHP